MKLKIKLEKQNKQNKQGLVPKKVLIHGPKGSFYSIRYVRVGEKEKEEKKEEKIDLKDMDVLIKEAKKYKNVEEFIKNNKIGKIIPITEKSKYEGQTMRWTEDMTQPRKAKEDIIAYHYSNHPIESFFPKTICMTTTSNSLGHCYAIKINKGDYIQHSPDMPPETHVTEVRMEINPNTKIQYVGEIKSKGSKIIDSVRYNDIEKNVIKPTFKSFTESQLINIWNKRKH